MNRTGQRLVFPGTVLLLLALAFASLCVGDSRLSPAELWDALCRNNPDSMATTIFWNIRLPRLIVSILVGAALSASGLVMQTYFRNNLASPGLLGVSAGGTAGAVLCIGFGIGAGSILVLPFFAIAGAFAATVIVMMLARQGAGTERLLLAGIALNAVLGAFASYVLSTTALAFDRDAKIIFWMLGGLEDRTWEYVWIALPIIPAAIFLWPLGRQMDLLSLGAPEAQSLGINVRALRAKLLVLSTLLTALATAVAGTIGFVGLMVPHLLRLLVGPEHRRLMPLSFAGGAAFVLACDLIGRFAGGMRIGIVTALVGGPFFLWLLKRK